MTREVLQVLYWSDPFMFRLRHRPVRVVLLFTLTIMLCLAMTPTPRSHRFKSVGEYVEAPDLLRQRRTANELLRAGKFLEAIREYQRGYDDARRRGDTRSARRFLSNSGSANFRLLRYRDAVKAYLQARALAASEGDNE